MLKPLAVFVGTIIGVGIFSLPFIALKAGFFVAFIYLILMTVISLVIHLIYSKVVLETEPKYRLSGYVGEYMGENWKKLCFAVIAIGMMGALLAYLIVGGDFLTSLFSPYIGGSNKLYTSLFFLIGAVLIFIDIKAISHIELILVAMLFLIMGVFSFKLLPLIDINNLKGINLSYILLPYGPILFSLWGSSVIPELEEMFGSGKRILNKTVISGILISSAVYLLFIIMILGVSGQFTSKEAISGLTPMGNIVKLGFIFGLICCFTSFLTIALTLKKTLWYDFGLNPYVAYILTCFTPIILFFLGIREFITVIGLTGGVALGIEAIIIVLLYRSFILRKGKKMNPFFYVLIGIFLLGIILETAYFFKII